ncbi:MAG: DUF485 domain-containing protein [Brachymonas sp.]|nr:DUF485 domain-containing protein [Brachymonas sp.]
MPDPIVERIQSNPKYAELKTKRTRFGWILTFVVLVLYYGFIALIAFDKELLAKPLGSGITTIGIPIGIAVILVPIILTGIYVARANGEFDRLNAEIIKEAQQ